jgi:protein-S-isoprenylcysteine O-methyltransferase Ste14
MTETRWTAWIYRWRVRAALFVLLAVIALARPGFRSIGAGLIICALGLLIRGWAAGHIQKEKRLAVSGPYRYTRNPLYLGNFLLGLSIAVGTNSWWGVGLFFAYFLVFYPPVILEELRRMKRLFPDEYESYRKQVPLFLPSFRRRAAGEGAKFRWELYRRNRETRALFGAAVVWTVLIVKMLVL